MVNSYILFSNSLTKFITYPCFSSNVGKIGSSKLTIENQSIPIKRIIKSFLAGLFVDLEKRLSDGINTFKCNLSSLKFY